MTGRAPHQHARDPRRRRRFIGSSTRTVFSGSIRLLSPPPTRRGMWRGGPHARGGIHEPGRASKSRPARLCDSTQARPLKMPSIRRLRRRPPGRSLHHQRNPWCGSKRLSLCGRAGTAASALAVLRGAGERPKTRLLCERDRGFESISLQQRVIQTRSGHADRRRCIRCGTRSDTAAFCAVAGKSLRTATSLSPIERHDEWNEARSSLGS
jgi:hypothetical protein